ncbi:hypothetical protein EGW08_005890 [Elysia chlorotica]|uniref:Uncharacterized protein n=1 Tax=Elysia chlorotica TaxID=188477 RepID=A0A3S1C971_ELYCH|nr:hypothetical protein EGW08_005890 [Elysia chlorotica]
MQQCQRRSANLPFQMEDDIQDELKLPDCVSTECPRIMSGTQQIPRIVLPQQTERRRSYQIFSSGKNSLLPSRRQSKSNSPCTRNSSRKPSLGLRDFDTFPAIYRESSEKYGRLATSMGDKRSDVSNPSVNDAKAFEFKRGDLIPQGRNLREAELVSTIHPHQEYLLHALTTLAINSLTSELTPREESEKALSYLSHSKIDESMSPSVEGGKQSKLSQIPVSRSNSSESFSNETLRLDELFASMEGTTDGAVNDDYTGDKTSNTEMGMQENNSGNFLKRSRINQLRNYLRYSGFGEPTVIVTSGSKADQIRLARLLQRMRKKENPQRQERLRLRARLDYEMSLMRAVSFCEQQEQILFRSASVDMVNTDLQMLEDDLKYQALQEMRQNARDLKSHRHGRKAETNIHRTHITTKNSDDAQDSIIHHDSMGREAEQAKAEVPQSPTNQQPESSCNTQSGTSLGYEGDILSGLLGSPLNKHELRDRIQIWLAGVAAATAGPHKEEHRYAVQD